MTILASGCSPETQPVVDVELREIATAAAANRVAGDELEVQLYFRPTRTMVTPFNGEVRRIALWSRMEPSVLRVQIPEGEYSQLRLVVRVARLCTGATVGFQNIGEGTLTARIVATFERVAAVSIAAHAVTQPTDCSAR